MKKTCGQCRWFHDDQCRRYIDPHTVDPESTGCLDFTDHDFPKAETVNHPAHYQSGGLECIDVIRAVTVDAFAGFLLGNIIKYLWRYRQKNGTEDLKKAAWYLDRLIKAEETP